MYACRIVLVSFSVLTENSHACQTLSFQVDMLAFIFRYPNRESLEYNEWNAFDFEGKNIHIRMRIYTIELD